MGWLVKTGIVCVVEEEGSEWCSMTGDIGSVLMRTAGHPVVTICSRGCWELAPMCGAVIADAWADSPCGVIKLANRAGDESLPPRNGGEREEHGEEEDEEEAGDWMSTSSGTHDENDDDGECAIGGGDVMPGAALFFFLPRLGGRVSAGGLDFLRGFFGLGSAAILS